MLKTLGGLLALSIGAGKQIGYLITEKELVNGINSIDDQEVERVLNNYPTWQIKRMLTNDYHPRIQKKAKKVLRERNVKF